MSNPGVKRSEQRRRQSLRKNLTFSLGVVTGVLVAFGGWFGVHEWQVSQLTASPAQVVVKTYFVDLAAAQAGKAEGLAAGQALAALRFNVAHKSLAKVPVLGLQAVPEETGARIALYAIAAETGGTLPSVARYQVLVLSTSKGWRVADVWQGSAPAVFGGTASAPNILATAKEWLLHVAKGDFRGSLGDLAGGALTAAEQTGQSGSAWARSVKIDTVRWSVLGTDGGWGAVEGQWQAVTPAGRTSVDLVLLGQMIAGRWRITRVVTLH